jgi:hypothetical protein
MLSQMKQVIADGGVTCLEQTVQQIVATFYMVISHTLVNSHHCVCDRVRVRESVAPIQIQ